VSEWLAPTSIAAVVLSGSALLYGCAVGPDFHRPVAASADRYTLQ